MSPPIVLLVLATVALGAAGGVARLLRGRAAAERHAVWTAGFAVAILLPALLPTVSAGGSGRPGIGGSSPLAVVLLAGWAAGTAVLLVRWAVHRVRIHRVGRRARALPPTHPVRRAVAAEIRRRGLRRPVRTVVAEDAAVPATWGLLRPTLLLPADAARWPRERLRAVVVHELAHVDRGDAAAQGVAELARALYWIHPLAWWGHRAAAREREAACDAEVLRLGMRPSAYARVLLEMARQAGGAGGTLGLRVGEVLAGPPARARPATALAAGLVVAVAGLPLARAVVPSGPGLPAPAPGGTVAAAAFPGPAAPAAPSTVAEVRALAHACSEEARGTLVSTLRAADRADLRAAAALALGERADARDGATLAATVDDATEASAVRRAALLGLRGMDSRSAAGAAVRRLGDPDPGLRILAVGALERMPSQAGWTRLHLTRALRSDGDERVRARAVTALARVAGEGALGPLLQARWDPSPRVRARARHALSAMEIT